MSGQDRFSMQRDSGVLHERGKRFGGVAVAPERRSNPIANGILVTACKEVALVLSLKVNCSNKGSVCAECDGVALWTAKNVSQDM